MMVEYIDTHREEFGVEPICRVLTEHGMQIAPSTYYDNVNRRPSRRALRDAEIVGLILAERGRQKLFARFGARKMWLHLRSQGVDVARCTIERLYAGLGRSAAHQADVELETLNWVDWFNHERPHEALTDLTPVVAEDLHYAARNELTPTG